MSGAWVNKTLFPSGEVPMDFPLLWAGKRQYSLSVSQLPQELVSKPQQSEFYKGEIPKTTEWPRDKALARYIDKCKSATWSKPRSGGKRAYYDMPAPNTESTGANNLYKRVQEELGWREQQPESNRDKYTGLCINKRLYAKPETPSYLYGTPLSAPLKENQTVEFRAPKEDNILNKWSEWKDGRVSYYGAGAHVWADGNDYMYSKAAMERTVKQLPEPVRKAETLRLTKREEDLARTMKQTRGVSPAPARPASAASVGGHTNRSGAPGYWDQPTARVPRTPTNRTVRWWSQQHPGMLPPQASTNLDNTRLLVPKLAQVERLGPGVATPKHRALYSR